jgi:tripartite-type tricarboxylate transporter receptor subunit TctC
MESFFGTLKTESLHHYRFTTREQARQVVFEYIEVFYNRIRRHAKIGNQVPAMISTLSGTINHIKSGKLKALAITSSQRSPLLPDVPTIAESGVPNYESDTWVGMFVPKATPEAVVQKLYKATVAALEDPNIKAKIEGLSGRIIAGSPSTLDALVSKEIRDFTKVVREQKIKPE